MGAGSSRGLGLVERVIGSGDEAAPAPATRTWGLENFGNTCYANSVLQALYACGPFRERALVYHAERSAAKADADEHLLAALAELFASIASQRKKTGSLAPKRFVQRLKQDNELFRSFQHQDAHEFLNFLLNSCCDILEREERAKLHRTTPVRTWVHDVFQGVLTNQTRCMWCEAVTNREESYLDLSLDIGRNSSVGACLRGFSAVETLAGADKFHCDACGGLQEAQKRMLIRSAPAVLALHLKRFKYAEALGMHTKLTHRVAFPARLRLGAAACVEAGSPDVNAEYTLFAVVVHVGSGPHHGHYVAFTKAAPAPPAPPPSAAAAALSAAAAAALPAAAPLAPELVAATASSAPAPAPGRAWVHFDDDGVEIVDEMVLQRLYGSDTPPTPQPEGAAAAASDDSASERGDGDDDVALGQAASAEQSAGGDAAMADAAPPPPSPGVYGVGGVGGVGPPSTEHGYILFYERVQTASKA